METSDDRFIVDTSTVSMSNMSKYTMVHDLSDEIGYVVVKGDESWMPDGAMYTPDVRVEIEKPVETEKPAEQTDAELDALDPLTNIQWDKLEQNVGELGPNAGSGVRVGIIDSGVLGANPNRDIEHPDLPVGETVLAGSADDPNRGPSYNFTGDGNGPGPALGEDFNKHGTAVAGTVAAAANGTGLVGIAPGAEIADLRVFSGEFASSGDILAAIVVGATPTDETVNARRLTTGSGREVDGARCDVLNLSLGTPPLVPAEPDESGELPELPGPLTPVPPGVVASIANQRGAAAEYALDRGTLPVASAGNSAVGLGIPVSDERQSPDVRVTDPNTLDSIVGPPATFPANAEGYLTVGATGPIGFGWPFEDGELESPIQLELPTEEPAQYTNYGTADPIGVVEGTVELSDSDETVLMSAELGTAVDVTAGGGNADAGARLAGEAWFYDLLSSTYFAEPESGGVVPTRIFIAGTSFSAPNVSGLAAILYERATDPTPEAIRRTIEESAEQLPIGQAGETSAPSVARNVALALAFDGDSPALPGSVPGRLDPEDHRGNGHIKTSAAIRQLDSS